MKPSTLSQLLNLSPAERIQLAQDLWDSIDDQDVPPLPLFLLSQIICQHFLPFR